jgi:hypothetical protein
VLMHASDNSLSLTTDERAQPHPGEFSSAAHVNSSEVGSPDLREGGFIRSKDSSKYTWQILWFLHGRRRAKGDGSDQCS